MKKTVKREFTEAYESIPSRNGGINYLAYAFAVSLSLLTIKNILIQGISVLYQYNGLMNVMIAVCSAGLYLYAIVFKTKKYYMYRSQLITLISIVFFWFLTYIINQSLFSYSYVREEFSQFIIYSLPAILFLPMLPDCEDLLLAFYKSRWLLFIASCASVLMMMSTGTIQTAGTRASVYSMAFGRAVLLPGFIFFSKWFRDHNTIDFLCGSICVLFILIFGSRFPILCIAVYIVWKVLQTPFNRRKAFMLVISVIAFFVVFINFNDILAFLIKHISERGINSRSLNLLTNGLFNYDSGRSTIFTQLIIEINKSPIFGYGAGGGVVALNNVLPHSFILDVFANIGYFFGGGFIIASFFRIGRMYIQSSAENTKDFLMICICSFFPICMIQTSMWSASYFWILYSLCCGRMRNRGIRE